MESKTYHDEIDLLALLAKFVHYLTENWIIALALPVLGGALGFFLAMNSSNRFESKMMIRSEVLSAAECNFLLSQFEQNRPFPGVPGEVSETVLKLSHEMILVDNGADIKKDVYVEILIRISNRENLPLLQNAILNFLEQSDAAQQRKNERKELYTTIISKITHELKLLDDVKTHTAYEAQANALKPSDLFTSAVDLTETKTSYEIKLKADRAINLVQGFNHVLDARYSQKTFTLLGVVTGLFVVLVTLFIKYFFSYYRQYRKAEAI